MAGLTRHLLRSRTILKKHFSPDYQQQTRQQTTTVDYKRLFNGLVLTDGFSLWHKT
jgi:hypothetical protein